LASSIPHKRNNCRGLHNKEMGLQKECLETLSSRLRHGFLYKSLQLFFIIQVYYLSSLSSLSLLASSQQQEKKEYTSKDIGKLRSSAETAFASGKSEQALELFSKVIQLEPKNERNYYKRFRVYLSQRKYREAIKDLSAALALKPKYKQALAQRGKMHQLMGRCKEAVEDLEHLAQIDPKNKELEHLQEAKNCADAIIGAEQAVQKGDWESAKKHLTVALDLTEVAHDLHLMKAQVCQELGDYYEVIAESGKAIKLEPEHLYSYEIRGLAYYMLAEAEMAANHFRECLKFDPENENCKSPYRKLRSMKKYIGRGDDAFNEKRLEDAIEAWNTAIEVDPHHKPVMGPLHAKIADAQILLKDFAGAKASATRAIEMQTNGHVQMGDAHMGLEEFEEAVREYKQAHDMDQGNREVQEKVKKAEAALKQSKQKNYYKILGVKRDADKKEIKKAYKKLALEWHPDKHNTDEEKEHAEKQFMDIAEAYEVLSDDELRGKYDRGEEVFENQGGGGGGHGFNPFQHFQRGGGGQHFHFHFG